MPRKRFSDKHIAFAVRQAETGTAVAKISRKFGIAEATFYRWKKVCWHGRRRDSTAETARRTDLESEAACRRSDARQDHAAGIL